MPELEEIPPQEPENRIVSANGRFQPGKSGNPGGRPKTRIISEAMRQILEETDPRTRKTLAHKLAKKAIQKAAAGSVNHLREITDRVEGKAVNDEEPQGQTIIIINPTVVSG